MEVDRRDWLKLFGVSTAAVAAIGKPSAESQNETTAPSQYGTYRHGTLKDDDWWKTARDIVSGCLYSGRTFERCALRGHEEFFNDGLTGLSDTNLTQARCLPAPEAFLVEQIGVLFSPRTPIELTAAICDRYALDLWINQKSYFTLPLSALLSLDENPGTATLSRMGALSLPLVLTSYCHFHASMNSATPLRMHGKFKMWVVLRGLHAHAVQ